MRADGRFMRRRLLTDSLLIALLLPLLLLWLDGRTGLPEANGMVYDRLLQTLPATASGDVVIIGIDKRSIDAIGPLPWPRSVHAQLLERLVPAAPRSVLFNVFFDADSARPEDDQHLARAIGALPVYLPLDYTDPSAASPGVRTGFTDPLAMLAQHAEGIGHANVAPDADDRVRTIFRYEGTAERLVPYVGLLMATGAQDASPADPVFEPRGGWSKLSRFGFRFAGPAGTYRTESFVDVLRGAVSADSLRGKYLMVGALADSRVNDQLAVVGVGARSSMPGVEIHANAFDALRQGRTLEFPTPVAGTLWKVVPIWIALALFLLSARHALASAMLLVTGCALLALIAVSQAHYMPPIATSMAGIALSYLLWSGRRFSAMLLFLRQRIDELNAVPSGAFEPPTTPRAVALDAVEERAHSLDRAILRLVGLQAMLTESLQMMPVAVAVCRADGVIAQSNAVARQLLTGQPPTAGPAGAGDPLEGRNLLDMLSRMQRKAISDGPQADAADRWAQAMDGEYTTAGHDVLRVHAVQLAGVGDARSSHRVVVLRDLTTERRVQGERERWFAFLSHDLRSPQVSILSLLALHADQESGRIDTAQLVQGVEREAHRTLALTENVMSMIETAAGRQDLSAIPMGDAAMDAIDASWHYAQSRGVVLVPMLGDDDCIVRADRPLLTRAVLNLLTNAIRHSAPGRTVHVCMSQSVLDGSAPGEAVLSVRDEGEGMSVEKLARILKTGARERAPGQPAQAHDVQGWGIGMSVVHAVIERHRGWLDAHSAPGVGSTFLLGLPLQALSMEEADYSRNTPQSVGDQRMLPTL